LIQVEIHADAAIAHMARVAGAAQNRTVPNRQLAIQLQGWVFRNFQQGGGMQTPPWSPLAEGTLAQKRKKGYSGTPLIRTGHLRQSFRPFSDNDVAGVGSEVSYSQYHETGTGKVPQRAMLPPRAVAIDYAIRIYDRWAAQVARTA
jgi:phage gpG-like protein